MFRNDKDNIAISKKDLFRKINYELKSNFFTLEEIKVMRLFKVKKIVKLIAKIKKISLSRKDVKSISLFLIYGYKEKSESVSKLWSFISHIKVKINETATFTISELKILFPFVYRLGRYDLMLD